MSENTLTTTDEPTITALSCHALREQVNLIQQVMREVMKPGEHYGKIPGCGDKPALLKPGAEKLGFTFRLAPSFSVTKTELEGGHREIAVTCRLTSIQSGAFIGEGVGSCSTMESKYRWRGGSRLCPECGKPAIKKSKFPPRNAPQEPPGYYCFAKVGGCGANFNHDDERITSQSEERQENPDLADQYNTVLKMAKKRAHVDAILTATAASDIFTQDIEDLHGEADAPVEEAPPPKPAPAQKQKKVDKSLPADGKALLTTLSDYDANLAKSGACQRGDLLKYVEQAGVRAGYEPDIGAWSGEAIALAVEETKAFAAQCKRKRQGGGDADEAPLAAQGASS